MVDPLILTGVFMLGASAGGLLTYVRQSCLLNGYEELLRGEYENSINPVLAEAMCDRRRPTSQLRVQPAHIAQSGGHPNSRRSRKPVPGTRSLTVLNDNASYGDQRLAQ
jgi:hypothetical protein